MKSSNNNNVLLTVLRLVMVMDLVGLMGAYLAGSCRETPATVYAAALVLALASYVGVHILQAAQPSQSREGDERRDAAPGDGEPHRRSAPVLAPKEQRKVLLLLSTFAAAITYVAGLNPPGGFWDASAMADAGWRGHRYRPGDSLVEAHHRGHFRMFFYCNTTAFVASLFTIVQLLVEKKPSATTTRRAVALQVFLLGALVCLVAAYDAGSCRDSTCSVYVVSLLGAVLGFIFLAMFVIIKINGCSRRNDGQAAAKVDLTGRSIADGSTPPATSNGPQGCSVANISARKTAMEKVKSLVLLLADLVATITYQAGLDPPGGFWPDDGEGHRAGEGILASEHPARYKAFFYCNTVALVVSLVAIILMVQNVKAVRSHTVLVMLMLDVFALAGAYAAGSCRDLWTSVHVVALAGAIPLFVLTQMLLGSKSNATNDGAKVPEKQHKRLLLVSIVVATITYQAGLSPPGGFWTQDDWRLGHRAGDAVLRHKHPLRFKAFFYCNTAGFMASVALILAVVNPKPPPRVNKSKWLSSYSPLYACQVAALLGLMGAYAAGSGWRWWTSIAVFALVASVMAAIAAAVVVNPNTAPAAVGVADGDGDSNEEPTPRSPKVKEYRDEVYAGRKYLMQLGILAASVTYQAGLAPPGGVWQDDGRGGGQREAGNPVLHDTEPRRFKVFFYSNSTSFIASVVVIALLLEQILRRHQQMGHMQLLHATNTAVVLDLLGLVVAYVAGSTRQWHMVVLLCLLVPLCVVTIQVLAWLLGEREDPAGAATAVHQVAT